MVVAYITKVKKLINGNKRLLFSFSIVGVMFFITILSLGVPQDTYSVGCGGQDADEMGAETSEENMVKDDSIYNDKYLKSATSTTPPMCPSREKLSIIKTIWSTQRIEIENNLRNGFQAGTFDRLYTMTYWLQATVQELFDMAVRCNELTILNEIYDLLLIPSEFLEDIQTYYFTCTGVPGEYGRTRQLARPSRTWTFQWRSPAGEMVPREPKLEVSQGVYLLAKALRVAAEANGRKRTQKMRTHISAYANMIRDDFIQRWVLDNDDDDNLEFNDYGVFDHCGWACNEGTFNHATFIDHLFNRRFGTNYFSRPIGNHICCNALKDQDLWIIAIVAEFLGANRADPVAVPIPETVRTALINYMAIATNLLQDRLSEQQLTDPDGNVVVGLDVDRGMNDDYNDGGHWYGYIGNINANFFPSEGDFAPVLGHGWDTSHGGERFLQVYQSLLHNKQAYAQVFPDNSILVGLARQILYQVYNNDSERPRFTTFLDGTNGWFRVYFEDGKAYPPWSGGKSVISGEIGNYSLYEPQVGDLMRDIWNLIEPLLLVRSTGIGPPLAIVQRGRGFENHVESVDGRIGKGMHIKNIDNRGDLVDYDMRSFVKLTNRNFSITGWFNPMGTQKTRGITLLAGFANVALLTHNGRFAIYEKNPDRYEVSNINAYDRQEYRHVALTRDRNGLTRLYVDGTLALERNTAQPATGRFFVGGQGRYWRYDGAVDEVSVYKKALRSEEVHDIANGRRGMGYGDRIAHWSFENTIDPELTQHFNTYFGGEFVNRVRVNRVNLDATTSMELAKFLATTPGG